MASTWTPKFEGKSNAGLPLAFGTLGTFDAGTSNPAITYTAKAGDVANTNPVQLDASGRANVWLVPSKFYKLVLKDRFGVTIWSVDNFGVSDPAGLADLYALLASADGPAKLGYKPPGNSIVSTLQGQLDRVIYASNYTDLQLAHDAVTATFPDGGVLVLDKSFAPTVPFEWDLNKVFIRGMKGMGSTLDFSGLRGVPYAIIWRNPARTNALKGLTDVRFVGPAASFGVNCLPLFSDVGDAITNVSFDGLTIIDFNVMTMWGKQCSNVSISNFVLRNSDENYRTSTAMATLAEGFANAGERWSWTNGQIGNVKLIGVNTAGVTGGWKFTQCALVYFERCFVQISPCVTTIGSGCHIESNLYSDTWFDVGGNGSRIHFADDTEFWFAGTVTGPIFRSRVDTVYGGIFLGDCSYHADGITTPYWADQNHLGPIRVKSWRAQDSQPRKPFGLNPGVQQEAWRGSKLEYGQTLVAGGADNSTVSVNSSENYNGPTTEVMAAGVGKVIQRSKRYKVQSGENIEGSLYLKTIGFGVDGTVFAVGLAVFDGTGKQIGSGGTAYLSPGGNLGVFTQISLSWYGVLPAGAEAYEVNFYAPPALTATARSLFIADTVINRV